MESSNLIFKAIPKIMTELGAIKKLQKNSAQGFMFRGIDDVYNNVQKILAKHGVFTVPIILNRTRNEVKSRGGGYGFHCVTEYVFRFFAEDGSYVEAHADGEAIDYGDKSANKCASIAHKYALLQVFCIPTEDLDDPEKYSHDLGQPVSENVPKNSTAAPQKREKGINGLDERTTKMVQSFKKLGVTFDKLEEMAGNSLDKLTDDDFNSLRDHYLKLAAKTIFHKI